MCKWAMSNCTIFDWNDILICEDALTYACGFKRFQNPTTKFAKNIPFYENTMCQNCQCVTSLWPNLRKTFRRLFRQLTLFFYMIIPNVLREIG